jgi:hypothetical protein
LRAIPLPELDAAREEPPDPLEREMLPDEPLLLGCALIRLLLPLERDGGE